MNFTIASLLVACAASEGFLKTIQLHQNAPTEPSALRESSEDKRRAVVHVSQCTITFDDGVSFQSYEIPLPSAEKVFENNFCKSAQQLNDEQKEPIEQLHDDVKALPRKDLELGKGDWTLFKDNFDNGERFVYTYVVMDNFMYAVQTAFDEEFISKHLVIANACEKVFSAGTFRFVRNGENRILVLDNNSGSYTPDGKALELTKKLIERDYPNLTVEILDVLTGEQSDELKQFVGPLEIKKEGKVMDTENLEYIAAYFVKYAIAPKAAVGGSPWKWSATGAPCTLLLADEK
jgi:hypothetical protein